jgi:hypothetical protein
MWTGAPRGGAPVHMRFANLSRVRQLAQPSIAVQVRDRTVLSRPRRHDTPGAQKHGPGPGKDLDLDLGSTRIEQSVARVITVTASSSDEADNQTTRLGPGGYCEYPGDPMRYFVVCSQAPRHAVVHRSRTHSQSRRHMEVLIWIPCLKAETLCAVQSIPTQIDGASSQTGNVAGSHSEAPHGPPRTLAGAILAHECVLSARTRCGAGGGFHRDKQWRQGRIGPR